MSPVDVVHAVGLIMGVGSVAVLTAAWARGRYRESAAAVWKSTAEAYQERARCLEAQVNEQEVRIAELETKVTVLADLVTGHHAIEDLGVRMDAKFTELLVAVRGR